MNSNTNQLLEKMLNYSAVRQRVISNNIANVSTANYKRKDVEFDEVLKTEKLKMTDARHFQIDNPSNSEFKVYDDNDGMNTSGYNDVDMDKEMAEMAKNTLMFKFAARKINGYYNTLQSVIKGRS